MRFLIAVLLLVLAVPAAACAEDVASAPAATAPAPAAQNDADLAKRVELSKKLHEVMPNSVRQQIDNAIDDVANQQPEAERESFRANIKAALNYEALEKISIDAMADIYTADELQAQIDYYSKPEAKSAAAKYDQYAARVYPEITRMLDKSIMRARTGGQ